MKKLLIGLSLLAFSAGASANDFFGGNNGEWKMGPQGPYYEESDFPEWTPMYWMEEMMDSFDSEDGYGGGDEGFMGGMPFMGNNSNMPFMGNNNNYPMMAPQMGMPMGAPMMAPQMGMPMMAPQMGMPMGAPMMAPQMAPMPAMPPMPTAPGATPGPSAN
ncbi:hypothetical protein HMY34_05785 [Thiothrix subterranea]|uniref:hypothetical protein n=1 Tax=Thiothrix subterranea TaxID=2735563 RepID=UPI00192C7793|nr:hypothetical protein [Thiothrix subterranea]QQZ28307.1 hypothetical protein HMY34_05785 [Thiothrix subterranea]